MFYVESFVSLWPPSEELMDAMTKSHKAITAARDAEGAEIRAERNYYAKLADAYAIKSGCGHDICLSLPLPCQDIHPLAPFIFASGIILAVCYLFDFFVRAITAASKKSWRRSAASCTLPRRRTAGKSTTGARSTTRVAMKGGTLHHHHGGDVYYTPGHQ